MSRHTEHILARLGLALAVLLPARAGAQDPALFVRPQVAPDEVDFEGLTSLSLGSGARRRRDRGVLEPRGTELPGPAGVLRGRHPQPLRTRRAGRRAERPAAG